MLMTQAIVLVRLLGPPCFVQLNLTECTFTSNFLQGSIFYLYELTSILLVPNVIRIALFSGFIVFYVNRFSHVRFTLWLRSANGMLWHNFHGTVYIKILPFIWCVKHRVFHYCSLDIFQLKSPSFLQFQQICGFAGFSKMMPYVGLFDFVVSHENLRQSEHIVHEKKA